jgi:hypothetical protein
MQIRILSTLDPGSELEKSDQGQKTSRIRNIVYKYTVLLFTYIL